MLSISPIVNTKVIAMINPRRAFVPIADMMAFGKVSDASRISSAKFESEIGFRLTQSSHLHI